MSTNHFYHTSLQQLRQLRASERITRVRAFAALMSGIMHSRSVHLSQIALKIEGRAKELSIVRRLERLLDNRAIDVREWYAPIAISWLHSQARTTGEVRLILDSTKVSFSHQQLMVALAFQRRAIPIVWTWRKGAKGHSSAGVQIALLSYVRNLLPKDVSVLVVGDSEFEGGELQAQLELWGWSYALRVRLSVLLAGIRQPGQLPRAERVGRGRIFDATPSPAGQSAGALGRRRRRTLVAGNQPAE